ncbi:DUF4145 domain-containing protein [Stenotrophomonas sp. 2694]|uniref:DUF4145 domain-containing protein n=1 Tax=Stenotrophomonas sp. 2694 TaxID=3156317 RepID=UPI0033986C0B
MATTTEYFINSTCDEVHNIACSTCSGKTTHHVKASYDQRTEFDSRHGSVSFHSDFQIVQCQGCSTISFREAHSNSEDWELNDDDEPSSVVVESLYPSRVEGIKGLGDDVRWLSSTVNLIYSETLQAMASNSPVLAGIGLRALLEMVCKEKSAVGKDLFHKIDSLVEVRVLTPASAAVLHKIRTLGNSAAHEAKPHTPKQLGLALSIVEHLLLEVYILPKKAEAEFGL